ncbi:hypothetical protein [Lactiplantibacillus paraplantarum]|nr:hypothetical protein [Lactiplantibacillus paraplantarum]
MKKMVNRLLGVALVVASITMLSSVSATANTYYHRTPTKATAKKTYYTTDTKSHTFRANGHYNRWTFKANHDLKNYRNTVWTTTQQTDITMHGKKVRYYWVHNSKNGATGWIWSGYLKPTKPKSAPSIATLVSRMKVAKKAQQIVTVIQNGSSTATLKLWQKNRTGWKNTLT